MIDQLKSLAIFVEVVEAHSFRGAAKRLDLSPSVVSNHVSSLESQIGVALLYRSTRSLSLTREGEELYEKASYMLRVARDGLDRFSTQASVRLTDLRIAVPATLSFHPIFQKIVNFGKLNKGIRINLVSSDRPSNLINDGIDVAIRMGHFRDSDLISRTIGSGSLILVGAPGYIKARQKLREPSDLLDWDFISFSPVPDNVTLSKTGSRAVNVWGKTAAITDSVETMRDLALAGIGIASLPYHAVTSDLEQKRLMPVLPQWTGKELKITVVWPRNATLSNSTREFIDFLSS